MEDVEEISEDLEDLLKDYEVQPVSFSGNDKIRAVYKWKIKSNGGDYEAYAESY